MPAEISCCRQKAIYTERCRPHKPKTTPPSTAKKVDSSDFATLPVLQYETTRTCKEGLDSCKALMSLLHDSHVVRVMKQGSRLSGVQTIRLWLTFMRNSYRYASVLKSFLPTDPEGEEEENGVVGKRWEGGKR